MVGCLDKRAFCQFHESNWTHASTQRGDSCRDLLHRVGAEIISLLAVVEAFCEQCPNLRFESVFNCEKDGSKRSFANSLRKVLKEEPGADYRPCCFDDITKLLKGEATCSVHLTTGGKSKKKIGQLCVSQTFEMVFCSSPCKGLSK